MKTFLTTASVIALMAGPAIAQETTVPKPTTPPAAQQDPAVPHEMAPPAAQQEPALPQEMAPAETAAYTGELSVGDLLNKSVKNAANEAVGDINDVRIDSSGTIAAVIVGAGGFLGLGEKNVALPFEELSFVRDGDGGLVITANVTKESLQAAPEWKKPEDR